MNETLQMLTGGDLRSEGKSMAKAVARALAELELTGER